MTDIVVRWAGPADASASSTYKIERSLDNDAWAVLAASQAATSPYVSPVSTIVGDTPYGATSIVLASASGFSSAGYGWLEDAQISWSGVSTDTLTGVVWYSGFGTYASGTSLTELHESYSDTSVTITNNAVLYRITHSSGVAISAPAHIWFLDPPLPEDSRICVVVTSVATDLGIEVQEGLTVQAYLTSDAEFDLSSGQHLDKGQSSAKSQLTNVFGLAFHQCVKNARREPVSGTDAAYYFVLDSTDATNKVTLQVDEIPDRDWVMLHHIVSAVV